MSILREFREFAMKGNVLDMAVGVIIGGAFGKIVSSLVNDVLMPIIGLLLGRIDFSSLSLWSIKYGMFLQSIVDFVIVAFCIFIAIKQINRFKKAPAPVAATPTAEVVLLTEIRDLIKQKA